jgi:hypothetical protein
MRKKFSKESMVKKNSKTCELIGNQIITGRRNGSVKHSRLNDIYGKSSPTKRFNVN